MGDEYLGSSELLQGWFKVGTRQFCKVSYPFIVDLVNLRKVTSCCRFWETSQGDSSLIVRSSSSILASLDSGSGDLSWRHVGELGEKTLVSERLSN